jgi:hypothetical protein
VTEFRYVEAEDAAKQKLLELGVTPLPYMAAILAVLPTKPSMESVPDAFAELPVTVFP